MRLLPAVLAAAISLSPAVLTATSAAASTPADDAAVVSTVRMSASWALSSSDVDEGARVTVTGRVHAVPASSAVVLQKRTGHGWKTVARLTRRGSTVTGRTPRAAVGRTSLRLAVVARGGTVTGFAAHTLRGYHLFELAAWLGDHRHDLSIQGHEDPYAASAVFSGAFGSAGDASIFMSYEGNRARTTRSHCRSADLDVAGRDATGDVVLITGPDAMRDFGGQIRAKSSRVVGTFTDTAHTHLHFAIGTAEFGIVARASQVFGEDDPNPQVAANGTISCY